MVDPVRPDPTAIAHAAATLRKGGVVAIPTDTLYGLAVDPWNPAAVARIFTLKGRDTDRALPLIAADIRQVRQWIGEMDATATRLAERFWPGPLTLVMHAPRALAPEVTAGGSTIGIRVPSHAVARALSATFDRPITATSANLSGQPATDDPDDVADRLSNGVDVLLDSGTTPGGPASTIVDVTHVDVRLIRAGAVAWEDVRACAQRE
ncbi:MAG TPA: L-threonylcarbamoyladenylate synthase [Candidatus Binatia bacterium]